MEGLATYIWIAAQIYVIQVVDINHLVKVNINNNNNIYLKSSIQTSSIDYTKYNDIYN